MKKKIAVGLSVLALGGMLLGSQPGPLYATEAPIAATQQTTNTNGAGLGLGLGRLQGGMITAVANLLGIDVNTVQSERHAGKSLVDIAKEKGVSEEKLVESVVTSRKTQLDTAVKAGQITQEQAQYCEDNMEARVKANLERTEVGPANGRGRGAAANVAGQGMGRGRGGQGRGMGIGQGLGTVSGYCYQVN